jgi:hypothetical protein
MNFDDKTPAQTTQLSPNNQAQLTGQEITEQPASGNTTKSKAS